MVELLVPASHKKTLTCKASIVLKLPLTLSVLMFPTLGRQQSLCARIPGAVPPISLVPVVLTKSIKIHYTLEC